VRDSMKNGPPPARAASTAPQVAVYTASTSEPSTTCVEMPYARGTSDSALALCSDVGEPRPLRSSGETLLFSMKNTTGTRQS
jgi:hypothetical protein